MSRNKLVSGNGLIAVQIFAVLAGLVLAAGAPPAQGNMMLVPLGQAAREQVAVLAIANGARLIQTGPFPSSLIVSGERTRLLTALGRHGILVVAAQPAGCGTTA